MKNVTFETTKEVANAEEAKEYREGLDAILTDEVYGFTARSDPQFGKVWDNPTTNMSVRQVSLVYDTPLLNHNFFVVSGGSFNEREQLAYDLRGFSVELGYRATNFSR